MSCGPSDIGMMASPSVPRHGVDWVQAASGDLRRGLDDHVVGNNAGEWQRSFRPADYKRRRPERYIRI